MSSLECLDYRRLGKQRVESYQIIQMLEGKPSRWKNHPAVKMWTGYTNSLILYYNLNLMVWEYRGYNNIKLQKMELVNDIMKYPWWFGNERFHQAHREALLWKNFGWYSRFKWVETPQLDYWWPIEEL